MRLARASQFDAYAYAQVRSVDGLAHNDFVRDSLPKVLAPTLIVYGSEDKLIPNAFLHGGFVSGVMKYGASKCGMSSAQSGWTFARCRRVATAKASITRCGR